MNTSYTNGHPSSHLPQHLAVIMDGNGRWAKLQGEPRIAGHQAGVHSVRRVLEESRKVGIRYVTLYAFSSENWARPASEVDALMGLFAEYLVKEKPTFLENQIRLRAIGDRARLPEKVQKQLDSLEQDTAHCDQMDLILAVSYGGRDEIVRAAQQFAQEFAKQVKSGISQPEELTVESFGGYLDTREIPDPDLLIRTSGEFRVSNFLLWQIAYAEIVVTETLWPDFSREEFHRCLEEYSKRERRFGKSDTGEEGEVSSLSRA